MVAFTGITFLLFLGSTYCGYTEYTILLWLSSDENMSPLSVWSNPGSSYNSNSSTSVKDLIDAGKLGYRNTFIDRWSDNPPDKIRLAFRNVKGQIISRSKFISTGLSNTEWFAETPASAKFLSYQLTHSYSSYSVDFAAFSSNLGAVRYHSASLKLSNGTVKYIVGASDKLAFLPAMPTAPSDCYASYQKSNPFAVNISTTNQTHVMCSALCRERDYPQGAVHEETCSCLKDTVTGPTVNACTIPCQGNSQEMCGGNVPPAVIFNAVNTDVDVSQFDIPLIPTEPVVITGHGQVSHQEPIHMYGFYIRILSANLPVAIDMILHYRIEPCSGTNIKNSTFETSFSVSTDETTYSLEIDPLFVQCVYISLYDNITTHELVFDVNITTITIKESSFVTAKFLTIEAAWQIGTTTSTTSTASPTSKSTAVEECECDCWVYNLLYGHSPFNNLSYEEIKKALKNVTDKLEKDLSVNKTTLSSSIRKKTSAEDNRVSAVAVGYSLGVALLVTSLGAILLADFPKMLESFSIVTGNLKSRFGHSEDEIEVFDTTQSEHTKEISIPGTRQTND